MGVGVSGLHTALMAKRRGADFSETLTIGRQNHFLNDGWIRWFFQRHGLTISDAAVADAVSTPYAEGLFRALGANRVDSMDASDYQEATIIHDMNTPIPPALVNKYSIIVDYGTLEHIFNIAIAIKNETDLIESRRPLSIYWACK